LKVIERAGGVAQWQSCLPRARALEKKKKKERKRKDKVIEFI
jgi:hypothetical protein